MLNRPARMPVVTQVMRPAVETCGLRYCTNDYEKKVATITIIYFYKTRL